MAYTLRVIEGGTTALWDTDERPTVDMLVGGVLQAKLRTRGGSVVDIISHGTIIVTETR